MMAPILGARPLSDVLFGDYLFRVPDYQRDYAWGPEQTERLLDTLLARLSAEPEAAETAPFCYLNNIVVNAYEPESGGTDGLSWPEFGVGRRAPYATGPRADLVDGQQRLTVLTMLVACLRDRVGVPAIADRLHRMVAADAPLGGRARDAEVYIVAGGGAAGEILRHTVQPRWATTMEVADASATDTASFALLASRRAIVARVDELAPAQRLDLAALLVERCYLSMVVVRHRTDDWRLFSELNDSGVRLSRSDRLKAALLGPIPEPERTRLVALWQARKALLGPDFDGEGRRYLFSYIAELACPGTSGSIAERIVARAEEMGHAAFMREVFEPFSAAYAHVVQARFEAADPAVALRIGQLIRFVRWAGEALRAAQETPGNLLIAPLVLWFAANRDDPERTLGFLTALDRTIYGMLIHHGSGELVLEKVATLHVLLAEDARGFDTEAHLSLATPSIRRNLERSLLGIPAKLVLVRLEAELEPDAAETLERCLGDEYDIEHILPRNAGRTWLETFGGKAQAKAVIELIGNKCVMLRADNRRAGNKPWPDKVRIMERAATLLPLGALIRSADPWSPQTLAERHRLLMAAADGVWDFGANRRTPRLLRAEAALRAPSTDATPRPLARDAALARTSVPRPAAAVVPIAAAPVAPAPKPRREGSRRRPPHLGGPRKM